MLWALHAPVPDPMAKLVLLALADQADGHGCGAYPSQGTIASTVPCDRATVQRKLALLVEHGLLARGDQQLVAHYRQDRRPVVYDLPITGPHAAAPSGLRGRTGTPDGAADGAAPVRHDPRETQGITPGQVARGETPDGAVAGCADHPGRRMPACAACQRVQPPTRDQVRPASQGAVQAAKDALRRPA